MNMEKRIRVLIVDDSALVRQSLRCILESDSAIEVVGEAHNGREGYEKTAAIRPDVITMDLSMPVMDGHEAVCAIMEDMPTPIIVVSAMDSKTIVRALDLGAMDFVAVTQEIDQISGDLLEKIKVASRVKPIRRIRIRPIPRKIVPRRESATHVVALGISTGGPQALQVVLSKLPEHFPAAILVVQHISAGFIHGLVEWLSLTTPLHPQIAKEGDSVKSGTVLFAPDNYHMVLSENGRIHLMQDKGQPLIHIPSIDVMMQSVAETFGDLAIGVLMTGMGRDGVDGMIAIKQAGGMTLAQDERTSAIFGMNKVAIDAGVIDKVVALEQIADELTHLVERK